MNYIGSKLKLSNFIFESIKNNITKPLENCVLCDLFAGTGAIGRIFKSKVKRVIANDKEYYSYVLNQNYIGNHFYLKDASYYLKHLNNLDSIRGKIYHNYTLSGTKDNIHQRSYFTDENAMRIDAIRQEINNLLNQNKINSNLYYFLLASLLEAADKVANVASVYSAFLKSFKPTALKRLNLLPMEFEITKNQHEVFNQNATDLIDNIYGDILYIDPPYNGREYGTNYHMLNTIALYDDFIPRGKTGLRDYEKSDFCKKATAYDAIETLIKKADFKWIFLSYNDEGILPLNDIKSIFTKYGNYNILSKYYQRFKADTNRIQKQDRVIEYLHILEK